MKMEGVASSNINSIGWENKLLNVEFKNGSVYQYEGVPKAVYDLLLSAESVGRTFNTLVKNSYTYKKI
jgi:hypothetical protein